MNEIVSGIGIFLLGILATIGSIYLVQLLFSGHGNTAPKPSEIQVTPEEFILENLFRLPAELSIEQLDRLKHDLRKRYRLSEDDAEEKLSSVIRSSAFERVTGARCTCYADSKQYGKYFHAPTCEYRRFLEEKGGNSKGA